MARTRKYYQAYSREQAQAKDLLGQSLGIEYDTVLDNPEQFYKQHLDPDTYFGQRPKFISEMDMPISEIKRRYDEYNMETPVSGDDLAKMAGTVDGEEKTFRLDKTTSSSYDPYQYYTEGAHGVFRDNDAPNYTIGWNVVEKRPSAPRDRANDPQRVMNTLDEMQASSDSLADSMGLRDENNSND
jgi:hypothetical protein